MGNRFFMGNRVDMGGFIRDRIQKDLAAIGSQTRENSRIRRGGGLCPKIATLNAKSLIFSPKMFGRKFDDILNSEQQRFLVLVELFS